MTGACLLAAVQIVPVFFLGLLAALLLVSRPATWREWMWVVVCLAAVAGWLRGSNSLADHTVRASAAFFIGGFIALTLMGVRSLFVRAATAVLFGAIAMITWYAAFHLRFTDLQNEIITNTWEAWRRVVAELPAAVPNAETIEQGGVSELVTWYATALTTGAFLFPAWIALIALGSARLAWSWYQRIARMPLLSPAGRLRDFRFNDHLIWLLVVLIAAMVVPLPASAALVAANALTLVGAFYALRGAAIARTAIVRPSPLFIIILLPIMLAFLPFFLAGLALLGIADTWLDFRRRAAPPSGVPS